MQENGRMIPHRSLMLFRTVVPTPFAAVTAVRFLDDIGVLAFIADRTIAFYPQGLRRLIHE